MTVALRFAIAAKLTNHVAHYNLIASDISSRWALSVEESGSLNLLLAEVLSAEGSDSLAVKFLSLYLKSSKKDLSPAESALVANALVNTLKSPISSFAERALLLEVFILPFSYLLPKFFF